MSIAGSPTKPAADPAGMDGPEAISATFVRIFEPTWSREFPPQRRLSSVHRGDGIPEMIVPSRWVVAFILVSVATIAQGSATTFRFPETGQSASDQAVLLAIDPVSWPIRGGLGIFLSKPRVRREPVLTPSRDNPKAPDNVATHHYGTVLLDEGKFRMWYYPVRTTESPNRLNQGPICYAESIDGLTWTKPVLRQVEVKGSRENNAIALPAEVIEGVQVIKDLKDPDPKRRYKMVFNPSHPDLVYSLRTATSPDGLDWTAGPQTPIGSFLEIGSLYQHNGLFMVNAQIWGRTEGGRAEGRQAYVWISPNFDTWLQEPAASFALPEPATGSGYFGKYSQVHLGVAGVSLGNVVIGLYGLWHERGWGENGTTCDFGLVLSHDGIHFHEPVRGHVFLSHLDSPVTPVPGKQYPTILTQSNSILNYGDETRIYHGRWRNAGYVAGERPDYWGECALATLPRDRWGSLALLPEVTEGFILPTQVRATKATIEGNVWSMPIQLPAAAETEIWINADAADQISVEIADERFNLNPDYSGARAGRTKTAGGLDCRIEWLRKDLGALKGKTVRLRLRMAKGSSEEPRFYALYLRTPAKRH